MQPKTVRITAECAAPAERVLAAAHDFTDRRSEIWPNVPKELMVVHAIGATTADVTEGTKKGPIYAWERCDYDWSMPGVVTATVTDSNVYACPSTWEIRATPNGTGSTVEMTWARTWRRNRLGRLFGVLYRVLGAGLFKGDVKRILRNIERLEAGDPTAV
jgi:hypothetical protein